MITRVTGDNSQIYQVRFEQAEEALKKSGSTDAEISSLNDYFFYIDELKNLDGQRYLILPVDEPMLEINANTRQINIKDTAFNATGISVQGDEVSETIFFCIDRYFDATDLGHEDMNIVIQWKHVSNGEQGVTNSFIRDVVSQPGKVIFGWPIGSEITSTPGKIQFSVRFYKTAVDISTNKKYITYSFNTLPQTAVIQPSLNYLTGVEGEIPADDHSSLILDRIVASESDGSLGQDALAPIFHDEWNLPEFHDLDENGMFKRYVQAYSEDGGTVSYDWRKIDTTEAGDTVPGASVVYELTTDSVAQENNIYYEKYTDMDGVVAYSPLIIATGSSFADPKNTYERFSVCTLTATGRYFVKATNTLGKKKESTNSIILTIPDPEMPVVTPSANEGTLSVILTKDENTDTYYGSLKVEAEGDADGKSKLSYQWYDKDKNMLPDGNTNEYVISGQNAKINAYYHVSVDNLRNKEVKTATSATFRITAPAQPAIIETPKEETSITLGGNSHVASIGVAVDKDSENAPLSDKYTCTWYRCKSQDFIPSDFDEVLGKPDVEMVDGKAEMIVDDTTHRGYVIYARVKNIVNGDSIEVNSPMYEIKYIGT